jgi:hypothetical protein
MAQKVGSQLGHCAVLFGALSYKAKEKHHQASVCDTGTFSLVGRGYDE